MLHLNNGDLVLNKLRVRSSTESSSTRTSTEIVATEIVRQENLEKPLKSVTGIQKLRKIVKKKKNLSSHFTQASVHKNVAF